MKGNVLLFDNQKGWGFIRGSDTKIILYITQILRTTEKEICMKKKLYLLK